MSRLLTDEEIVAAVRGKVLMNFPVDLLPNTASRLIAKAQDTKTLKEVGKQILLNSIPHSGDFLLPKSIAETLLRGEMPEEVKGE